MIEGPGGYEGGQGQLGWLQWHMICYICIILLYTVPIRFLFYPLYYTHTSQHDKSPCPAAHQPIRSYLYMWCQEREREEILFSLEQQYQLISIYVEMRMRNGKFCRRNNTDAPKCISHSLSWLHIKGLLSLLEPIYNSIYVRISCKPQMSSFKHGAICIASRNPHIVIDQSSQLFNCDVSIRNPR